MTEDIRTLSALVHSRTAGRVGVTTYSPGDGQTRYALGVSDGRHDYFADRRIMSCRGASNACAMITAFIAGLDYRQ